MMRPVLKITLVMASVAVMCTARSRAHDWPMWGYDARRSGASPAAMDLPRTLHLQWMRELDPPLRAWPAQQDDGDKLAFDLSYSPVAAHGTLFVGSMVADRLTAYRMSDGEEQWRFYAGGPIRLAPAVADGKVVFGADDGTVYCLDAATGALSWSVTLAPSDHRVLGNARVISMWPVRGGPVIKDGHVYVAAGVWPFLGTVLYALDLDTGTVTWANTGEGDAWHGQPHGGAYAFAGLAPQGYLAASGDRLVVSGGRGYPALVERSTGRILLNHPRGFMEGSHIGPGDVKGDGGYRVRIQGEYYFNHGRRYRLSDGFSFGAGAIDDPAVTALEAHVASVADRLDAPVFERLVASGKLVVVTTSGRLYCFGAQPVEDAALLKDEPRPLLPAATPAGHLAETIIDRTGVHDGYALVLGAGDDDFLEQLAVRSALQLVAFESDPRRVDALRRRLDDAGLYGTRVALVEGTFGSRHYPPLIASLVIAADVAAAGLTLNGETFGRIYDQLRPYTGRAWLGGVDDRAASGTFEPVNGRIVVDDGVAILSREGPLPGAGRWTHQYADSAQTVMSADERVRPPFGPIWFGGVSNVNILPRHGHGPVPQVVGGRLFILGFQSLTARCVFTGRDFWVRRFPGVGYPFTVPHYEDEWTLGEPVVMPGESPESAESFPVWRSWGGIGAHYIGSPYVSLDDAVYIRYGRQVHRLDPQTGDSASTIDIPGLAGTKSFADWGHISVWNDHLIVTDVLLEYPPESPRHRPWVPVSSRRLHVLDRHSGEVHWTAEAETGFRHNAVVSGGGRVFVIDGVSSAERELQERRGDTPKPGCLIALNITTGEEHWRLSESVFGTWLGYSEEHDVLIQTGMRNAWRREQSDEPGDRIVAVRGADGTVLWDRQFEHTGPLVIHGRRIIPGPSTRRDGPPGVLDLLTGEDVHRRNPLTGADIPWTYTRMYGCSTHNAGLHVVTLRSGAAGYVDLQHGGMGTLGGFRAGCSHNLVAADGVLNAPDYTRTCNCSYQNQTSLGLVHMPEMDAWTTDDFPSTDGRIMQLGVNLAAPGNRRDADGTLWVPKPRTTAPAPMVDVLLDTYDYAASGVNITGVRSSDNAHQANLSLDGNADTFWKTVSNHEGTFDHWIQYDLSDVLTLDQVTMAWDGPLGTQFSIEVSDDAETWTSVYQNPAYAVDVALDMELPEDGWRFRTDPDDQGMSEGWYEPDHDDQEWDTFSTGRSWTRTPAYAHYAGAGWYRRSFTLPERPDDIDAVELVFGGVDETARVWINGQVAGMHDIGPAGWDKPFALWVGDLLRWGETNHITVCARNTVRAGGIWRPVHLVAMRLEGSGEGTWREQFERAGRGGCRFRNVPATYAFTPVAARHVRIVFGAHEDFGEDSRGRRVPRELMLSRVRIGGLEWPAAYSMFVPKDTFRWHTLMVDSGAGGLPWVAASGVRGVKSLRIGGIAGGGRPYTVSMHFCEPDDIRPGERIFDVRLQGRTVVSNLDLTRETGGSRRAVVRAFAGITLDDELLLEMAPAAGSRLMPVLSGVSIVAE